LRFLRFCYWFFGFSPVSINEHDKRARIVILGALYHLPLPE
jgi:hypothetical protein